MPPMVRTVLTHLGTAAGAGISVALWTASNSVDLYAIIDQFNTTITEIGKLVALVVPFATTAYGVYRASTRRKIEDIEKDPRVKGVVTTQSLASDLGPKVQSSVAALPAAAKGSI